MSGGQVSVVTDDTLCVALRALLEQNRRNGVDDLQWLDAGQVRQLEPAVSCVAALWSLSTGIFDAHALMMALQPDAEASGTSPIFHTPLAPARCARRALDRTPACMAFWMCLMHKPTITCIVTSQPARLHSSIAPAICVNREPSFLAMVLMGLDAAEAEHSARQKIKRLGFQLTTLGRSQG
jgi:hypothetical protein